MRNAPKRKAVLEYIRSKGPDGAMFSEIQRFVVEMNGHNYDERDSRWDPVNQVVVADGGGRRWRGYWCVNLYGVGGYYGHPSEGILRKYCKQLPNRRYVLKEGV